MDSAIIRYGSIVEVHPAAQREHWGFIIPNDGLRSPIFFHTKERGVLIRGEYGFPLIAVKSTLEKDSLGSTAVPTIRLKTDPAVGDLVAYYLGRSEKGPCAKMWCIIPPNNKNGIMPGAAQTVKQVG